MELHIKCQKEFDEIQDDFQGTIYIESNNKLIDIDRGFANTGMYARYNSMVNISTNTELIACHNSLVIANYSSIVFAKDDTTILAFNFSHVEANENSSVVAFNNSSVGAWENAFVVANENSSVVAHENSSVEAREMSSVIAHGNSLVELNDFSQARIMSKEVKYKTFDKSRVILPFTNFEDFAEYYGIKVTDGIATMYIALYKRDGFYETNFDNKRYKIGRTVNISSIDNEENLCGRELHLYTMKDALDARYVWAGLTIIECESKIEDIVMPMISEGTVRTKSLKVIREVPLEECGLYGKILARRRNNG